MEGRPYIAGVAAIRPLWHPDLAMKVSLETVRRYAGVYRQQAAAAEHDRRACAARVLARLPALAQMLRRDFGAHRVGYFGSLRSGVLHGTSDVDLYVDRLPRGQYFDAVSRLWTALERPVDLVELERASPSLRAAIEEEGIDLDG